MGLVTDWGDAMTPALKVHLDTDLGGDPDDLCALALLLNWPGVELIGITTVVEARGRRAGYTRYALQLAGRDDIPVAAGAGADQQPVDFPDEPLYWPEPIPPAPGPVEEALALLRQSIDQGAIVIGIGPYTNLALLERAYPGRLANAPLYLMGGHIYPVPAGYPQWGYEADYNVQFDAPSAQQVLAHCRPTFTPLEMTVQTALRRAYLPALRASGPLGSLLARQAEAHDQIWRNAATYGQPSTGLPDDVLNFQHDALACAVALGWDGVQVREMRLRALSHDSRLALREDVAGDPARVVTAVEGQRFNELWLNVCTRGSANSEASRRREELARNAGGAGTVRRKR